MKNTNTEKTQDIVVFRPKGSKITVEVQLKHETVWLSQAEVAILFGTKRPAITKHLLNIFRNKELSQKAVCSILEHTAADGKSYKTQYYNLDAIISIGYRVNSARATQFRIWATKVLKQHLIQGYTINNKRIKEHSESLKTLQNAVKMLADLSQRKALTSDEATGLFEVIRDYSYGLDVLDDYDHGRIEIKSATAKECYQLTYEEGIQLIQQMKKRFGGSGLFGHEKDGSFKSSLGAIYQTFGGKDLYPSVEEKASNLLYLVVKNHSFSDGNKRIAAALFIYFLDRNKILYKADGSKRIADNALVAITLMIAESQSKEKEIIVALVVNLINKLN
jgi:prophage maintenance system killer protein